MCAAEVNPSLGTVLQDETGAYSTSRCAFWATLAFSLWVVYTDVTSVVERAREVGVEMAMSAIPAVAAVSGLGDARVAVYGFLSGILVAEILWAAGSKGISSIAPAIASAGQVFAAIAGRAVPSRAVAAATAVPVAAAPPRQSAEPDPLTDDESGG